MSERVLWVWLLVLSGVACWVVSAGWMHRAHLANDTDQTIYAGHGLRFLVLGVAPLVVALGVRLHGATSRRSPEPLTRRPYQPPPERSRGRACREGQRAKVARMTYDLAVWEGEAPTSDKAASAFYQRLMDGVEGDQAPEPPSPRMTAYVDALLPRWPDITDDGSEDSPWADGPMIANAFGNAIYFSMVWSRAEEASEFAAHLAEQHELVCYDPQSETLRPSRATSTDRPSWFRRFRKLG
jgi:hypothetical protein